VAITFGIIPGVPIEFFIRIRTLIQDLGFLLGITMPTDAFRFGNFKKIPGDILPAGSVQVELGAFR
jgi:hypothetical protein